MGVYILFNRIAYGAVSTKTAVIIFGGYSGSRDIVAQYSGTWSKLGTLNKKGYGHVAIKFENTVMVLGGDTSK